MGSSLCCSRDPNTSKSMMRNIGEDKFLSDTNTFSVKEQEYQLKVAKLEEQRLGREAEKVNILVKHESARFDHCL
ncbi:unnamed protein product [Cochlearia groenlandica]